MNNPILEQLHKNRIVYVHALEVDSVYHLQAVIEELVNEWHKQYKQAHILEFFNTISIYALNEENEEEIHSFNIEEYIKEELY